MADTGAPGFIPLYDDTTSFAPIQDPFNGTSQAVNAALIAMQKTVAPTVANQAARDALYPTPTQGNRVLRADLGWEEMYYTLYNSGTNPGGATPAGWYPIAGVKAGGKVLRAVTTVTFPAITWTLVTGSSDLVPAGGKAATGVSAYNGTWVAPFAGMWKVEAQISVNAAVSIFLAVKKNSTTLDTANAVVLNTAAGASGLTAANVSGTVKLAAGDILRLAVFPSASAPWNTTDVLSFFGIEFVEPVR
jgi:hypothetical protein